MNYLSTYYKTSDIDYTIYHPTLLNDEYIDYY